MLIVQTIYVYINFLNQKEHHKNTRDRDPLFFQGFLHVNTIYFTTHMAWVIIPWKYSKYRELWMYSEVK